MSSGQPNRLRKGLPGWLGGQVAPFGGDRRRLWDDIAAWLDERDLDPTPANYAMAHGFVTGSRSAAEPAAAREPTPGVSPDLLTGIAEALEEKLSEALGIVGQQVESTRAYGHALDEGMRGAASDPVDAFGRLIAMTGEVVVATRALEGQLESTRRDARKLRSDLSNARRAAERDHLTGLPNRRFFDAQLAARTSGSGCLALCDIDDFKRINDAHGHETGDRVLRFVAKSLADELHGKALVARYGGEEFACLFDTCDLAEARAALDRMRERLKARSLVDRSSGTPLGKLTFSAGLALIEVQPRAAVRAADGALYAAKRAGKDRVELAVSG